MFSARLFALRADVCPANRSRFPLPVAVFQLANKGIAKRRSSRAHIESRIRKHVRDNVTDRLPKDLVGRLRG